MKKTTLVLIVAAMAFACKNEKIVKTNPLEKVAWLEGTWENNSPEGNLSETWTKENDSVFKGQTYFIKGKDTLHNESITLTQKGEDLIYSPTVQGQNNNKAIDFKLTVSTANQLSFENKAHDYPQKIVYTKVTNDSIVAEISGIQQGKASSEKYPMKKKQ